MPNQPIVPGGVTIVTAYDVDVTSVKNVGSLLAKAKYALVQADGGECRLRQDGSNPSLTVGSIIEDKQWHPDLITDLNKANVIGTAKANFVGYIPD